MLPEHLTEPVSMAEATESPDNELYETFDADTDMHKWHHFFDIDTWNFEPYRSKPIKMFKIGFFRGGSLHS